MIKSRLIEYAGPPERHPQASVAVNRLIGAVFKSVGLRTVMSGSVGHGAMELVRDFAVELTQLEIEGLITAGDEHEFARWALTADEMSQK